MKTETWYVLEDGSVADPSECGLDAKGILVHKSGVAVKVRGDTHWSRGVDVEAERAKAKTPPKPQSQSKTTQQQSKPIAQPVSEPKDMKPDEPQLGYLTRDSKAD